MTPPGAIRSPGSLPASTTTASSTLRLRLASGSPRPAPTPSPDGRSNWVPGSRGWRGLANAAACRSWRPLTGRRACSTSMAAPGPTAQPSSMGRRSRSSRAAVIFSGQSTARQGPSPARLPESIESGWRRPRTAARSGRCGSNPSPASGCTSQRPPASSPLRDSPSTWRCSTRRRRRSTSTWSRVSSARPRMPRATSQRSSRACRSRTSPATASMWRASWTARPTTPSLIPGHRAACGWLSRRRRRWPPTGAGPRSATRSPTTKVPRPRSRSRSPTCSVIARS